MKRILTLDGGGIHGLFTLGILGKVEAILRARYEKPDLVLGDHYDLIAGTSTGAIIATALAWGEPVATVRERYLANARIAFRKSSFFRQHKFRYGRESISDYLRGWFAEADGSPALLGTDRLRSLLLVVMRNGSTGSPWPVSNNPTARFNDRSLPDCNLNIPLWQLVRASTAAPTYFPAETIQLGDQQFDFIDGGISPYNNPAFIAYQQATLAPYRLEWPTGEDQLHLLSVGTGTLKPIPRKNSFHDMHVIDHVQNVVTSLMYSSAVQQDLCCRMLGRTLYGAVIDSEVGDLGELHREGTAAFTYTRFDKLYTPAEQDAALRESKRGLVLDNLDLIPFITDQGERYAESYVSPEHIR
ncbi:MAG: patatin-like phospholipase family protein [Opitutales bacterium]|nr:patatin-like phospholipase family protein [Opitutales bacterium]